jgi:hypothetical protein
MELLFTSFVAYFENPNDWLFQKNEEKSGRAPKFDYANANVSSPQQIVLTSIWAIIVFAYTANAFYFLQNGGGSIFDSVSFFIKE